MHSKFPPPRDTIVRLIIAPRINPTRIIATKIFFAMFPPNISGEKIGENVSKSPDLSSWGRPVKVDVEISLKAVSNEGEEGIPFYFSCVEIAVAVVFVCKWIKLCVFASFPCCLLDLGCAMRQLHPLLNMYSGISIHKPLVLHLLPKIFWIRACTGLRSLHRAYPSLHLSGVVHWVPEQWNIKAVTEHGSWLMVAAEKAVFSHTFWHMPQKKVNSTACSASVTGSILE